MERRYTSTMEVLSLTVERTLRVAERPAETSWSMSAIAVTTDAGIRDTKVPR